MPSSANNHGSPKSFFGRSFLAMGREQVHSVEPAHDSSLSEDQELQSFQRDLSNRFHDLSSASDNELLSLEWVKKLLDTFLSCLEDFRVLLSNNRSQIPKPPLDRLVSDYFEKSVKALDICNATRDGVERVKQWEKHLEIVLSAFDSRQRTTLSEGQLRRGRKALTELAISMMEEKDSGSIFSHRNKSFGRHGGSKDKQHPRQAGHSRSLSWSVSPSWSATKQLQSIASSLVPPNRNDILATNGLATSVFAMSCVLMFVLWVLVAVIPCQDRGLQCHFSIPRHFSWGTPILILYERIMEEAKRREKKNSNGLMKEICNMEKCARHMTDFLDSVDVPLTDGQKEELANGVEELSVVCGVLKCGFDPLELKVREAFRRIMSCRMEGLDLLGGAGGSQ